jgi:HEAT repeat protein
MWMFSAKALNSLGWKPTDDVQCAWLCVALGEWDKSEKLGAAAIKPLLAALKRTNGDARASAATALGNIGSGQGVDQLLAALGSDANSSVRYAIVKALGKIRDPRAIDHLLLALTQACECLPQKL